MNMFTGECLTQVGFRSEGLDLPTEYWVDDMEWIYLYSTLRYPQFFVVPSRWFHAVMFLIGRSKFLSVGCGPFSRQQFQYSMGLSVNRR